MRKGKKLSIFLALTTAFALLFAACSAASVVSETDGQFIRIILESRSDKALASVLDWEGCGWKREARGGGAVGEVSFGEYFGAVEKELSKNAAEDGKTVLPDYPVPGGYAEFYFKGVRPGFVELHVTCSSPNRDAPYAEARFKLSVSPELKISVLDSSEKYDWGGLL